MLLPTIASPNCLSSVEDGIAVVSAESIYGNSEYKIDFIRFGVSVGGTVLTAEYDMDDESSPILYHIFSIDMGRTAEIGWFIEAVNSAGGLSRALGADVHGDFGATDTRLFIGHLSAYLSLIQTENMLGTENVEALHGISGEQLEDFFGKGHGERTENFLKGAGVIRTADFASSRRVVQLFGFEEGRGVIITTSIDKSGGIVATESFSVSMEVIKTVSMLEGSRIIVLGEKQYY